MTYPLCYGAPPFKTTFRLHRATYKTVLLNFSSVLIGRNEIIKISDFGTSRTWGGEQSTCMSFAGTVAWMAPEVIRNEPCNEKVSTTDI